MDAVTILKLVSEMKFIDAFLRDVFANDTFLKHAGAHDILVIYRCCDYADIGSRN